MKVDPTAIKAPVESYQDEEFVEITKKYADIILPKGGNNSVAVELIQAQIQTLLKEKMPNN